MSFCHFTLDFNGLYFSLRGQMCKARWSPFREVSRHHRHSRQVILSSRKKRLRSFFSPLQEQEFWVTEFISSNAGHILLFAPAQINPSAKDGSRVSQKRTLHASKTSAYRLGAKLLSLVPKSLIFYEATNTQIEATSTQLAKRAETRG